MNGRRQQPVARSADTLGIPPRKTPPAQARPPAGTPTWLERRALHKLLALMGNPPVCFVLWNGEQVPAGGPVERRRLWLRDRRTLWRLVSNPELNFGDAYSRGDLDVEGDLAGFLEMINRTRRFTEWRKQPRVMRLPGAMKLARVLPDSGFNIQQHYNLGNDFFRLWLDEDMVYTCAYFPTATASLEQAQRAKMDHICRKLRLQAGDSVIEAGCGWGSLARYMAREYGVTVRAYNISSEQVRYARERAAAEGLEQQVEFIERDYRDIEGRCDVFVSVGMLEHVGLDNYRTLGEVIDRCLTPDGRGLIHSIGRDQSCPMNAWIEKRIFPNAYPPTLREMMEIFEPHGFSVLDVENLRLHYARTLEHWLARFDARQDEIRARFDEAFVRAWRLYLAGSMVSFTTGWLQLFQVLFTRNGNNDIAWTREHLYA